MPSCSAASSKDAHAARSLVLRIAPGAADAGMLRGRLCAEQERRDSFSFLAANDASCRIGDLTLIEPLRLASGSTCWHPQPRVCAVTAHHRVGVQGYHR